VGSGASVQAYAKANPWVLERTLIYHDSAVAARFIKQPVFCACAEFDPVVAPAGQFAIYNALGGPKSLQVLRAGHFEYPGAAEEREILTRNLVNFFGGV
jgi:cephalosporin-C deacetylase